MSAQLEGLEESLTKLAMEREREEIEASECSGASRVRVIDLAHLDVTQVGLTKPDVVRGHRVSLPYIECQQTLKRRGLFIQLPLSTVSERNENSVVLALESREENESTLRSLEDHVINYLFTRSQAFFDGKAFSLNRFRESLRSSVSLKGLHVALCPDSKIRDQYEAPLDTSSIVVEDSLVGIIALRHIVFSGRDISFDWQLVQGKVFKQDDLTDWYLQDDDKCSHEEPQNDDADANTFVNDDDKSFF
jgi:hypothetical protein